MSQFTDLDPFAARRAKLKAWQEAGVNPYPDTVPERLYLSDVRQKGKALAGTDQTLTGVTAAGRIYGLRGQGGLCFMDIQDGSGKIQLLFKQDHLSREGWGRLDWLDLGDFIWVQGNLFVSQRGELTVDVSEWGILSKALRPLPDLWKGLQDPEQRQRQRYAELIVNPKVKERFLQRSRLVRALRAFMESEGFMEVETPVLESIPGGADAEPFITHHNSLDVDLYLRISLELHLKRLIVGGFDKVFEIGRVFRNEGLSPQHLQEFTMFEFYWAYADYLKLMELVEAMFSAAIQETFASLQIQRGENRLDFSPPWPRHSYVELVKQYAGVDLLSVSDEELLKVVREQGLAVEENLGRGRLMDLLYKKTVRPHLIQPQFVVDYPVEFSPLAKRKPEEPRLTERFVLLADGAEIGNAFSELNDPIDQRERFEVQEKLRQAGDKEAQRLDEDFLRALEYGMPPTAGFGAGIDRLLAVLTDVDSIRETVFFPTMRPEN